MYNNMIGYFRKFITKGAISSVVFMLVMVVGLSNCSNGEQGQGKSNDKASNKGLKSLMSKPLPEGHPTMKDNASYATISPEEHSKVKSTRRVEVSDEVKAKWKNVSLMVSDNSTGSKKTLKVDIGASVKLGENGFSLKAKVFLPHYTIFDDQNYIGSRSNDPLNPAVQLSLYEGDKLVTEGWVFEEMTQYNSFSNLRFSVALLPSW